MAELTPDLTALRAHVQAHASICAVERSLLDMLEAEQQRAQRLQGLAFQLITETPGMDTRRIEAAAGRAVDMQERLEAAEAHITLLEHNATVNASIHARTVSELEAAEAKLSEWERECTPDKHHSECDTCFDRDVKLARYEAALFKYGSHRDWCDSRNSGRPFEGCNCGYNDCLAVPESTEKAPTDS